jgi:hypothetical protein
MPRFFPPASPERAIGVASLSKRQDRQTADPTAHGGFPRSAADGVK